MAFARFLRPGLHSNQTPSGMYGTFKGHYVPSMTWGRGLILKSSMPFKRDLGLQNTPLSKQPFKTQPQIEYEDVTCSPQYNMPATRTNKRRALSLQKVKFRWLNLNSSHWSVNTYHIIPAQVQDEFCVSFLYSWI